MRFAFETVSVDIRGNIIAREQHEAQQYLEELGNGTLLEMVVIEGGDFLMGCPETEEGWHSSQSPQHLVTLPPFCISKHPITQAQWQAIANAPKVQTSLPLNPSHFDGASRPVEQVSWVEALEFCDRLSQKVNKPYHLPSEAQWEYACRAHTLTPFHFGESITTSIANYSGVNWEYMGKICSQGYYGQADLGEDRRETTPVGSFRLANGFGLYDLHGNVREWCADSWHSNYNLAPQDGSAWIGDNDKRVVRGGSWNESPKKCRSGYRAKFPEIASLYDLGFRVVCEAFR